MILPSFWQSQLSGLPRVSCYLVAILHGWKMFQFLDAWLQDVAAPRMEDFLGDAAASAAREVPEQAQLQPEAQDASRQDARVHVPAAAVLPSRAGQVLPLPPPRAGGPGVAGSSGKREPDRHFNFWKEDELKLGNAEVKVFISPLRMHPLLSSSYLYHGWACSMTVSFAALDLCTCRLCHVGAHYQHVKASQSKSARQR